MVLGIYCFSKLICIVININCDVKKKILFFFWNLGLNNNKINVNGKVYVKGNWLFLLIFIFIDLLLCCRVFCEFN